MCGICGELNFHGALPELSSIRRMLDRLERRGPDHEGMWSDGSLAFGHRRLSILDLSERAHQPMLDPGLGYAVVFNGTIYNFRDLRAQLEARGHQFFSTGDTEVILKDGETFAIAGLIDNRVISVLNKLKYLGDIPVLGNLFRSRSQRKSTDELLVVVTPRFVRPIPADEKVKLPDQPEQFLPSVVEEKAKKGGKKQDPKKESKKAEFVGPRGHQEPK